jgi:hypothetical protein
MLPERTWLKRSLAAFMFLGGIGYLLAPLWADDTPPYPPIIGTLAIGPIWVAMSVMLWLSTREDNHGS